MHPPIAFRHQTVAWFSKDGKRWSEAWKIGAPNFWLWRVTWHKGRAYGFGSGRPTGNRWVGVYTSSNGRKFEVLADKVFAEAYPDETSMVFLEDDRRYCPLRGGAKPNTAQLGIAKPPYKQWSWKDLGVRVGGPHMIRVPDGRFVAVVRLYGPVRTSVCWLDPEKGALTEPFRLASGRDSSYAGLVWHERLLWVSYYSSHEGKTSIYLARVRFDGSRQFGPSRKLHRRLPSTGRWRFSDG